jgi:DNA-directed RNA polymerase subunit L
MPTQDLQRLHQRFEALEREEQALKNRLQRASDDARPILQRALVSIMEQMVEINRQIEELDNREIANLQMAMAYIKKKGM